MSILALRLCVRGMAAQWPSLQLGCCMRLTGLTAAADAVVLHAVHDGAAGR